MITADDLDACFLTGDFAQRGTFTVGGSDVVVSGYFSGGSDAADLYGVQVEAVDPTFTCPTSEISGVTRGTALLIDGEERPLVYNGNRLVYNAAPLLTSGATDAYTVQRVQKVGTGVSVCYLKPTV